MPELDQHRTRSLGVLKRPAHLARSSLARIVDLALPPACAVCHQAIDRHQALCAACWSELQFVDEPMCPVLGIPLPPGVPQGAYSVEALANPPDFDRARFAVRYSGSALGLVRRFKYGDRPELAPFMARLMLRAGNRFLAEADVIVPVPLHWSRLAMRQFNQAAELARALAQRVEKPCCVDAVIRAKRTRQQIGLQAAQRTLNVAGAFQINTHAQDRLAGAHVVLVDDVYTTGATVAAVSRILQRAGTAQITVLAFARVLPDI